MAVQILVALIDGMEWSLYCLPRR
eukprot:SAG11_NODE_26216_length_348_cov_0.827309_1_plen_23_part_10